MGADGLDRIGIQQCTSGPGGCVCVKGSHGQHSSLARHSGGEAAPLKDAGSSPGSSRAKEVAKGPSQSRLPPKPPGELGRSQVNS